VKDNHHDDNGVNVSVETLARHILETPRKELAALRAAFDRHMSSIEARLDASSHQAAIDASSKLIADAIDECVERAQLRAESDVTQALAVNAMLQKALDNAQQQAASAQAALKDAEPDRKAAAAQHREIVKEKKALETQLRNSQQEAEELRVELLDVQKKLKDVTAAKVAAESQYQQLAAASQKLTEGLSRKLEGQRERPRPAPVPAPVAVQAPAPAAPAKSTKKPLQFSGVARDAKRVKIRPGTPVTVDGMPAELVDLSVGGAQAVVRQMVKPNYLVRMFFPTAAGQLICKGRIVWVVYEHPSTSLSVYRFGVAFADIDVKAVEDFMRDYGEEPLAPSRRASEIA
jgi:hypothetical protein